jgi:hypothetical protein
MRDKLLNEILALHDRHAGDSELPGNLGDGFIYRHNALFRNVRDGVKRLGYSFTQDDFCGYRSLSLLALPKLIQARKVYYVDNVSILREIESKRPNTYVFKEIPTVQMNWMLHEQSHLIAESVFKTEGRSAGTAAENAELMMNVFMSEAFASTTELMGNLNVETEEHAFFYGQNSLWAYDPAKRAAFKELESLFGFEGLFRALWVSQIMHNLRYDFVSPADYVRAVRWGLKEEPPQVPALASLYQFFAQNLKRNTYFNDLVSPFFLSYFFGIKITAAEMPAIDILALLEKDPRVSEKLDSLLELIRPKVAEKPKKADLKKAG